MTFKKQLLILFIGRLLFSLTTPLHAQIVQGNENQLWHLDEHSKINNAWDSLICDFEYNKNNSHDIKVVLNYTNNQAYYFLNIKEAAAGIQFNLGQKHNQHVRFIEEYKYQIKLISGHQYRVKIYRAPMVDIEHWKQWKLELHDLTSNTRLIKEPVENRMPFFGYGQVGLEANQAFKKIKIATYHHRKDLNERHLRPDLLFASGMILQQGKSFYVWGKAKPHSSIQVEIDKKIAKGNADEHGNWRLLMPALIIGNEYTMAITDGIEIVKFENIAVGEVWFASGQSNMDMRAWQSDFNEQKKLLKNQQNIKFYVQQQWPSNHPNDQTIGEWISLDDDRILGVSAVALSFALNLYREHQVPIAIIQSAWGGTGIQSWMPYTSLTKIPAAQPMLSRVAKYQSQLDSGSVVSAVWPDVWDIPGLHHAPYALYNGMINPFRDFPVRGFLWYQGESNTHRASQYEQLLPSFIKSMRDTWNDKKMPLIVVQLAGYDGRLSGNEQVGAWPYLRDIQRQVVVKDNRAALVSAFDLGDSLDIHPYKKWELGKRMAYAGLKLAYNKRTFLYTGPLMKNVSMKGSDAVVTFVKNTVDLSEISNKIEGFEVAGEDRIFYPAKASILSDTKVKLKSDAVQIIKSVRYGWENYPVKSKFKNDAGLIAIPFRTDNWPIKDMYAY